MMHEGSVAGMSYRCGEIDGARQTLLFIHGLSGSLSAWFRFEKMLDAEFNIVEVDLRGHGHSRRPEDLSAYGPEGSAGDIISVLEELHVERSIAISHSYGTIVALEMLRSQPERFAGAIFISPVYGLRRRRLAALMRFLVSFVAGVLRYLPHRGKAGERTDYALYTPASDWDIHRISADVRNTGLRSYFLSFKQIYMKDRDAEWKALSMPVCIVHGTRDSYVPVRFAKALLQEIPGSRLELIEGGNHILPLNDTDKIADVIRSFAGSLSHT